MKAKLNKKIGIAAASAALASAFPTYAFASETKEGIAVLIPDMNEFVPMLVAFLIILFVLAKFGWPIVDNIVEKRATTIRTALKKSEEAQVEAERTLAEYKKELADAKAQAAEIVAEAKKTGEAVKADIEAKAQAEATAMIEKAKQTIEAEKKAAVAELQGSIADISTSVAERLIGESLTDDEHRKIIERYVNEAGNFNA
ncbi:MAG: F0F1 ATP synthase subunit B [Coriobacteriia bacterium]|nr:F0F1 ATP synthase subunit B [Coriobacteriia bacterium]